MPGKVELDIVNNNMGKMAGLSIFLQDAILNALQRIGLHLERVAKLHIQAQDLPWEPLSPGYLAWKQRNGYSTATYIMTSSYMQAITHDFAREAEGWVLIVGVMRSAPYHSETGRPMHEIADILEYGYLEHNTKIPPRPLWLPTLEQNKRSIQTTLGISIAAGIKRFEATFGV